MGGVLTFLIEVAADFLRDIVTSIVVSQHEKKKRKKKKKG